MSDRRHEIERKYLLSGMPALPAVSEALQIEQGYLDPAAQPRGPIGSGGVQRILTGRIRKTIRPDGSMIFHHTIKRGSGLVREEIERAISLGQFEDAWPRTARRRLRKTRHRVAEGGLVWEIDEFRDCPLVLAEIELPSAETLVTIPAWLMPLVVREVTDDPSFGNFAIATRIGDS